MRARRCRRDREKSYDDPDYNEEESSRGGDSRRSRDKSRETIGHCEESPLHGRHDYNNVTLDDMSRALRRAVRSPFFEEIERTEMPRQFNRPLFIIYNGKTDPIKHMSHYIRMMSLYSQNDGLICKVFPSSLGSTAMRWFNDLRKGFIRNFGE